MLALVTGRIGPWLLDFSVLGLCRHVDTHEPGKRVDFYTLDYIVSHQSLD